MYYIKRMDLVAEGEDFGAFSLLLCYWQTFRCFLVPWAFLIQYRISSCHVLPWTLEIRKELKPWKAITVSSACQMDCMEQSDKRWSNFPWAKQGNGFTPMVLLRFGSGQCCGTAGCSVPHSFRVSASILSSCSSLCTVYVHGFPLGPPLVSSHLPKSYQ